MFLKDKYHFDKKILITEKEWAAIIVYLIVEPFEKNSFRMTNIFMFMSLLNIHAMEARNFKKRYRGSSTERIQSQ